MKINLSLLVCTTILYFGCTAPVQTSVSVRETVATAPAAGQTEPTYQVFYDELAPFGRWVTYPEYGYVWVPNVGSGFRPYSTNGHWVYSNSGWTWVSNYNWGWAAFHYGRWLYEDTYGWVWLPGHEWAPAWVTWGHSGGYYGWAPLGPRINVGDTWSPPSHYWTFVPQEHINKPNIENYVVDRSRNEVIQKNITIINNHTVNVVNNNNTVINNNSVTNNKINNTTVNNNVTNNTVNNNNVTNNVAVNKTAVMNNNIPNNNQHINNTQFNSGPHIAEVEKASNTHIEPVNINEHNKPAQSTVTDNKLYMYRPAIMHEEKQKQIQVNKPAPKNAEQYKQHNQ